MRKARHQLYETLDSVKEAVKTCFDQDDLEVLNEIESCLITAANKDYSSSNELLNKLSGLSEIIDLDDLKSELEEPPAHTKLHNRESEIPLLKVTKVLTIFDVLKTYPKLTSVDFLQCRAISIGNRRQEFQCCVSDQIMAAFNYV